MNIPAHVFVDIFHFSGGLVCSQALNYGSRGNCSLVWRTARMFSPKWPHHFRLPQLCMREPISPQSHQHFFSFFHCWGRTQSFVMLGKHLHSQPSRTRLIFCIVAILLNVKCYLSMGLLCISGMSSNVKNLFMGHLCVFFGKMSTQILYPYLVVKPFYLVVRILYIF